MKIRGRLKVTKDFFLIFKDVKSFGRVKMRSGSWRRNNTSLRNVQITVGTQWEVGHAQRPLHRHAYSCGHTFLC